MNTSDFLDKALLHGGASGTGLIFMAKVIFLCGGWEFSSPLRSVGQIN